MSVVAPPPVTPPEPDELELLIPEARARQRKRWLIGAAVLLGVVGLGLAIWDTWSPGGSAVVHGHGPVSSGVGNVNAPSGLLHTGINDVGTSGGVTWVTGEQRLWLTADGGRTWRSVHLRPLGCGLDKGSCRPISNLGDVQFVDRQHGWITSTDRAGIYRTTDGGRTWHVSVPPHCYRGCDGAGIDFLDARHGYALVGVRAAGSNRLYRTDDGGRTWQLVSQPGIWGPIRFVNREDGLAFGPGQMVIGIYAGPSIGTLYRTTDGGRTWSKSDIGGSESFDELPIEKFGGHVVLVQNGPNRNGGLNLRPGSVWSSGDAGRNWNGVAVPAGVGVLSSFSAVSPRDWFFSSNRHVYVTHDAGQSWRKFVLRGLPPKTPIRKIAFSSPRLGWAVVPRTLAGVRGAGTLLRTMDGGRHWTVSGPLAPKRHRRR